MIFFSKHVFISVLSLCLFVGVCVASFVYFHSVWLTYDWTRVFFIFFVCLSLSLILCISSLLDTVESNSNDSKERAGLKTHKVTSTWYETEHLTENERRRITNVNLISDAYETTNANKNAVMFYHLLLKKYSHYDFQKHTTKESAG